MMPVRYTSLGDFFFQTQTRFFQATLQASRVLIEILPAVTLCTKSPSSWPPEFGSSSSSSSSNLLFFWTGTPFSRRLAASAYHEPSRSTMRAGFVALALILSPRNTAGLAALFGHRCAIHGPGSASTAATSSSQQRPLVTLRCSARLSHLRSRARPNARSRRTLPERARDGNCPTGLWDGGGDP